MTLTATYSPEDNKLRLYADRRLDEETYTRVKDAGFRWAAKQELFVAPAWTPHREDLLLELCGEIGDEDTSLVDRAEQRADRFSGYSGSRARDAKAAHTAVKELADGIPFGQPILVGHHSERMARKHAEKIERGMQKAVNLWETSQYWEQRAAGALHHAKYKERPDVRARRIKKLEAEKRKKEREKTEAEGFLTLWTNPDKELTRDRAMKIANHDYISARFPLDKYPRPPEASQYEGSMSIWSALEGGVIGADKAREISVRCHERVVAWTKRWIAHLDNRLTYERAMLEEQGAADLLKPKARPKQPPLLNYRAPEGVQIPNEYRRGEMIHHPMVEMTKAEYAAIPKDYRGGRAVGNHRVRIAIAVYLPAERLPAGISRHAYCYVFLTDSKEHPRPEPAEAAPKPVEQPRPAPRAPAPAPEPTEFDALREQLEQGVQVATSPSLYPTPREVVDQMIDLAELESGDTVLEPSAGTGAIIDGVLAAVDTEVLAYELNGSLCDLLRSKYPSHKVQVRQRNFLEVTDFQGQYPRVLMNPPFERGADIKHIQHALSMLRPGGRLVAICANGPRQRDILKPLAEQSGGQWIDLPAGTFKQSGTGVNSALLVIMN